MTSVRKLHKDQTGALPPRYSFALNPYADARFTKCPRCGAKTRVRKIPLVVHVDSLGLFILRKTCRLCVVCETLIAHQGEIEPLIDAFRRRQGANNRQGAYVVLGTVECRVWRRGLSGGMPPDELFRHMADFKAYLRIDRTPGGWCRSSEGDG
jgi:hypothetical protein